MYICLLVAISVSCSPMSNSGESENEDAEVAILPPDSLEDSLDISFEEVEVQAPLAVLPELGIGKPKPNPKEIEGHQLLTWDDLRDVNFEKKYYESEGQYFDYPNYGERIQKREGEQVYISGYLLPVNPDSNSYVLSAYTFSSCFFCGQAGPESIVELMLEEKLDSDYVTDQWIAFKGALRLNADDLDHLYYILDEAVEVGLE